MSDPIGRASLIVTLAVIVVLGVAARRENRWDGEEPPTEGNKT